MGFGYDVSVMIVGFGYDVHLFGALVACCFIYDASDCIMYIAM